MKAPCARVSPGGKPRAWLRPREAEPGGELHLGPTVLSLEQLLKTQRDGVRRNVGVTQVTPTSQLWKLRSRVGSQLAAVSERTWAGDPGSQVQYTFNLASAAVVIPVGRASLTLLKNALLFEQNCTMLEYQSALTSMANH